MGDWMGYFGLINPCFMPLSFLFLICRTDIEFQRLISKGTWGVYFAGIEHDTIWQRSFYLIFMLRRLIYVSLEFYCDIIIFQLLGIFYINIFMLIYQGLIKPLTGRFRNRIELFNEVCICLICIHMVCFTKWQPNYEA